MRRKSTYRKRLDSSKSLVPYKKNKVATKKIERTNHFILKLICKITGIKITASSDAEYILNMIIPLLLGYAYNELQTLLFSAGADVLSTGTFSLVQLTSVLGRVISRSGKLQNELIRCLGKTTITNYLGSFIGAEKEQINVMKEIEALVSKRVEFTKKELQQVISLIPENLSETDPNILDNIDNTQLMGEIEDSSDTLDIEYKGIKEQCPQFYQPLSTIIDQELNNAIISIKTNVRDEIVVHKMMAINKSQEVSYYTGIVAIVVILSLIILTKTFVIKNILKCIRMKESSSPRVLLLRSSSNSKSKSKSKSKSPISTRRRSLRIKNKNKNKNEIIYI